MSETSASTATAVESINLESVWMEMEKWRKNKGDYASRGIPDKIWLQVFQLEAQGQYTEQALKRAFTLNSEQYKKKRAQLLAEPRLLGSIEEVEGGTGKSEADSNSASHFGEAVVSSTLPPEPQEVPPLSPPADAAAKKTQQAITTLKSTACASTDYLDFDTVIVECERADGQRLKIHTTTQRLDVVMQAFYGQGAIAA